MVGRSYVTEDAKLWLLSWAPGQGTAPHDHGGASGAFTVLPGELAEDYRQGRGGPIRAAIRREGSSLGFVSERIHRLRNLSLGAASVHAYSPPLPPTREYPHVEG